MSKLIYFFDNLVNYIAYIFLSVLFFTVLIQVIFRYLLGSPLVWTIELSRYCLVWLTFLGAYLGLRRGGAHITMSMVYNKFSNTAKWYLDLIGNFSMLAFFIFIIRYGSDLSLKTMQSNPESFNFPMGIIYSILPLAGILFSFHCALELVHLFRERRDL